MAHAVDQSCVVEGLPVKEPAQINGYLLLVGPVPDLLFHFLEHLNHLDVGAAVAGALQGTDGGCNDRIGIRQGRGDDVGGEGGVVTAAVLHM